MAGATCRRVFQNQSTTAMSAENLDDISEARRQAIAETIHIISVDEVTALCDMLFPNTDHPWREVLLRFIKENPGATFHHATTHDRIHIIYCGAKEQGFWFMPGSGTGPLQAKGLKVLKEIVGGL
jgi:hypothetical protein